MPAESAEIAAALLDFEARLPGFVEHIPAVMLIEVLDSSTRTGARAIYVSPQIRGMLGYAPEELIADPDFVLRTLHPDDRERVLDEEIRTTRTGEPFDLEYRMLARDGRTVWVHARSIFVGEEESG